MKQDLTYITIVLDRSGSMSSLKEDTEGGFKAFLETQKKATGECKMSLIQFDTEYETVYKDKPIAEVCNLILVPRGGTALYDALNKAIVTLGESLDKLPEAERPAKVVIVVMTDGQENSSKEISLPILRDKIKHQQEKYNWQFVYIGSELNSEKDGLSLGIPSDNVLRNTRANTVQTYSALSGNLKNYRDGLTATAAFSEDDKNQLGK